MGFSFLKVLDDRPCFPRHFQVMSVGLIQPPARLSYEKRLAKISVALDQLLREQAIDYLVMERAFAGVNIATAIKLGEIRGLIMGVAMRHEVEIAELTPAEVKKEITGNGRASKEEIEFSLKHLLNFNRGQLSFDATDALAIGLTFGMKLGRLIGSNPPLNSL